MRIAFASFALVASLFGVVFAGAKMESNVFILNDDNFDAEVTSHDNLLVFFYAPWCTVCTEFQSVYAKTAAKLLEQDPPRFIAKVDATQNKKLTDRYNIYGFPTIKFFNKGKATPYAGPRTIESIVSFVMKNTGGPVSNEVTCDQLKERATNKLNLAYFGDLEGQNFEAFLAAAKQPAIFQDFAFFHTADKRCASHFGTSAPGVALIRTFDNSPLSLSAKRGQNLKAAEILDFAKENKTPTIEEFGEESFDPVFNKKEAAIILFTYDINSNYGKAFTQAAKTLKNKIHFIQSTSYVDDELHRRLASHVSVTEDQLPTLVIIKPTEHSTIKYRYDGDIENMNAADISAWVENYLAGDLSPYYKSQSVLQVRGPYEILVGSNHNQVANDRTKDVLVVYYAPYCAHSKKVNKIMRDVARQYAEVDNLTIASFDATQNEAEGLVVKNYPTVIFYPRNSKVGIQYDGEREYDAFVSWIESHSAVVKEHNRHTEL